MFGAVEEAMPCRVAFERGKERLVHLLVVLRETSGSLLLVEETPFKQRRGVIRVTAPLAGSDVRWPLSLHFNCLNGLMVNISHV